MDQNYSSFWCYSSNKSHTISSLAERHAKKGSFVIRKSVHQPISKRPCVVCRSTDRVAFGIQAQKCTYRKKSKPDVSQKAANSLPAVMLGLDPSIHGLRAGVWVLGSGPRMTAGRVAPPPPERIPPTAASTQTKKPRHAAMTGLSSFQFRQLLTPVPLSSPSHGRLAPGRVGCWSAGCAAFRSAGRCRRCR